MKIESFEVRYNSRGHIDLDDLQRHLNLPIMLLWLLDRVRGVDLFAPTDHQSLELPTGLFVDLWKRSKKHHLRTRLLMDQAVALALQKRLLPQKSEQELLNLAAVMNGARDTRHLLLSVVSEIASGRNPFSKQEIEAGHDDEWLFAATCLEGDQPLEDWKKLFRTKRYMETAFYGLRNDLEVGLYYLPEYWRRVKLETKSEDAADGVLYDQIADISEMFPYSSLEFHLKRHEKRIRRICQKLPDKIDGSLRSISKKPVFSKK